MGLDTSDNVKLQCISGFHPGSWKSSVNFLTAPNIYPVSKKIPSKLVPVANEVSVIISAMSFVGWASSTSSITGFDGQCHTTLLLKNFWWAVFCIYNRSHESSSIISMAAKTTSVSRPRGTAGTRPSLVRCEPAGCRQSTLDDSRFCP